MGIVLLGVDNFVSQTFGNGVHVLEGVFSGSSSDEEDGGVNSSEGGDVDGLLSDHTTGSDTGGVFSGAGVHDGSDEDVQGVSAGEEVDHLE